MPVDVASGNDYEHERADGNRSTADKHANKVWEEAMDCVKTVRAILVTPG